jgi:hypothetical protein
MGFQRFKNTKEGMLVKQDGEYLLAGEVKCKVLELIRSRENMNKYYDGKQELSEWDKNQYYTNKECIGELEQVLKLL